jgi:Spy/CpxP family protein refolding chaperone
MKGKQLLGFLVVTGVSLWLTTGVMAMEKGPGMGPEGKMQGHSEIDESALGLNEEQRAQMKALREEGKAKMESVRAEMKAKRQALQAELDGPNPDRGKAESIAKEILVIEEQMTKDHIDRVLKVRSILTPEQYQRLRELREKKRSEMKEKHMEMRNTMQKEGK